MTLNDLLLERHVALADGATGTNLFAVGLASGEAPELWNRLHPGRIRALHEAFVASGADILLTNSFGCNRRRLALHREESAVRELAERSAAIARSVVSHAARPIVVAGSVGPTGDLLAPLGPLTEEDAIAVFVEQIEGLAAGGADVIWIETMSALDEIRAATAAAARVGIACTATASFDTAGRTMMGVAPAALALAVTGFPVPPVAVGANCGVGAADLVMSTLAMSEATPGSVLIAKANAGVPRFEQGQIRYSGTPELMARFAALAIDSGARIVGGCCGTTPAHLAAMRHAVDRRAPRPRPTLESVIAALGPLAAPPASPDRLESARRRRRSSPT